MKLKGMNWDVFVNDGAFSSNGMWMTSIKNKTLKEEMVKNFELKED